MTPTTRTNLRMILKTAKNVFDLDGNAKTQQMNNFSQLNKTLDRLDLRKSKDKSVLWSELVAICDDHAGTPISNSLELFLSNIATKWRGTLAKLLDQYL